MITVIICVQIRTLAKRALGWSRLKLFDRELSKTEEGKRK